jgi:hypothetical protein
MTQTRVNLSSQPSNTLLVDSTIFMQQWRLHLGVPHYTPTLESFLDPAQIMNQHALPITKWLSSLDSDGKNEREERKESRGRD